MMDLGAVYIAILAVGGLTAGVVIGFLVRKRLVESRIEAIETYSKKVLAEAQKEARTTKREAALQAKDTLYQMKLEFEKETKEKREALKIQERRLLNKTEALDKKIEQLETREERLAEKEKGVEKIEREIRKREKEHKRLVAEQRRELERLAGISAEEAKQILVNSMEMEAKHDAAKLIRRIENEARSEADRRSQEIIALAVKRYSGDYASERVVSVVNLPNEEMKGRIIGREGRNIRAIEAATGIDLIIDDTPEAVILSGFNPVRRQVAKVSLERLIDDGRIHPARIEEVVSKANKEIETSIKEAGEQATFDVGVHGISHELVKLIGRLKYRSSYAQNVLQHSIEVSSLCGIMAAELGVNVKQAKRAGLLHDIGKAVDHEVEGPHATIGADLARRHGETPQVIHAIAAHHEDVQPESVLAVLVQAADTLSGARPGARQEMLESYVKRLEKLEKIASSFHGVSKSYAIQAGREIRIMVEGKIVDDDQSFMLCNDIAKQIEKELTYPGQIKVTVIRETRAVGYAK
ncbi:MAG: ribonuclease Y [Deltaproteobacteria bacterium]|nr:ribonuclease Y [Deltaproteobacteria bacterium]MBW2110191.1 ribonuclease Y [Deltaproteobacteria bacterium]MBW2352669.1 ribonuclease Y [Deltaproteobacteria bacterium]HDZ91350.1 ribonuclease Y [Deltaproteobacteria bacterium]